MSVESKHSEMVYRLCKSGEDILAKMTPFKMHLLHMSSKLCSEAGELMDAVGKFCFYNKELDEKNVEEELGDIEFYIEGLRNKMGILRETCLQANIDKLYTRYPNRVFSDKDAQERKDKQ